MHVTTKVPGVLDMRSDASELPAETKAIKNGPRDGFDAFLWGGGVQGTGSVTVEDRKYWIIGLIPVFNDSATEEIQSAVGDGALRQVKIGEQLSLWNVGVSACVPTLLTPCTLGLSTLLELAMPPWDFRMSGTRAKLAAEPAAPVEPAPADPSAAPPAEPGATSDIPPLAPGEE